MRPKDPVTYSNGEIYGILYRDSDLKYSTYAEFIENQDHFQAAFPPSYKMHPRIAEVSYMLFPCAHKFFIEWLLRDDKIVDLRANESWVCL